jgi:Glyoxalase-like domain
VKLDHVLIAVDDLAAADAELRATHGVASVEGGRHPGWGTANRIVPLGDSYLELVAVVDAAEAAGDPFGRWVAESRGAFAWAVRTDDLEAAARRLGLEVGAGSRARPDGSTLRWRSAGVDRAAAEPLLPFLIQWDPGTVLPGQAPIEHPRGTAALQEVRLRGDASRLAEWLGPHDLPVTVMPGEPGVEGFVLGA